MLGRTHFFVGAATALIILRPETNSLLVPGMGAAAIGGVISDIDSGTSQAHQEADKIVMSSVLALAAVVLGEYHYHLGIYNRLINDSNIYRILLGFSVLIGLCIFGMRQPHRSFMHSFLALFLFTSCVEVIFPTVAPYFAIGFASHLVIDLLNKRGEKLLWPMKKSFSLKLCSSRGLINELLMTVGMMISAAYITSLTTPSGYIWSLDNIERILASFL